MLRSPGRSVREESRATAHIVGLDHFGIFGGGDAAGLEASRDAAGAFHGDLLLASIRSRGCERGWPTTKAAGALLHCGARQAEGKKRVSTARTRGYDAALARAPLSCPDIAPLDAARLTRLCIRGGTVVARQDLSKKRVGLRIDRAKVQGASLAIILIITPGFGKEEKGMNRSKKARGCEGSDI